MKSGQFARMKFWKKTICRCLPPENRWYKALARCSLFNFAASVSFWRFKDLNGFFPRTSRRIFLAEKSEIPSFLANFRVEFTGRRVSLDHSFSALDIP